MKRTKVNSNEALSFDGIAYQGISRRAFLLSTTGMAIGVAFAGPLGLREVFGQQSNYSPNAWMTVAADGTVTIMSPSSEMGQGVMTAMPLLIAEEMDLDWSRVKIAQAPADFKTFGNPLFGGIMTTGASRTTRGYYDIMRLAGLQARGVMMSAAGRKWGVPILELTTEPHHVVHRASGRRMNYGEIAAFATVPAGMPQFTRANLKPVSQHRLIGKNLPRVDVPDKVTGKAEFGIDVRMAGMLYAAVLRAPVQGEAPESIDDAAAKKIPGVRQIVRMPYGVGVIADTYPAARNAKAALKVSWTRKSRARAYTTEKVLAEYLGRVRNLSDAGVSRNHGDPKGAMARAAKRLVGEYTALNVAHACMEPMNCTARADGDKIEVWAPSQSPFGIFLTAVKGFGYRPDNLNTHITLMGGGFGRRGDVDYAADAMILARAMPGLPVKVIWSREDDIHFDTFRPLVALRLEAGLDEQGNITALHTRIAAESISARALPPLFETWKGFDEVLMEGADETEYAIPNVGAEYLREQRGIAVGFWRGVGNGYTKFAIETMVDEAAAVAGKDPVDYRVQLLSKHPRGQAVVRTVADMAGWKRKRPAGRALGIAYSDAWETHCAQVAEVSVDRKTGAIRVHEVWCAVDCGVALQPANVADQMESGIVFGISAFRQKVTFKDGEPQQSNFHDYPVLRMNETPRITTKVIVTDSKPGGIGEVGTPPIAPAVANAVFRLTGKRLRSLPFDQELLKA